MSHYHCTITCFDDHVEVMDGNTKPSTNGTYVHFNNKATFESGTILRIGQITFLKLLIDLSLIHTE